MNKIIKIFLIFTFVFIIHSCSKEKASVPIVATGDVTDITQTTAISGGIVSDDGGSGVTGRGICWSAKENPTINDNATSDGTGSGSFSSLLTNLDPHTRYYLRAYATNSAGTGYGEQKTFSTYAMLFNPDLTYGSVTDIEGNNYKTIMIGTRRWMAENLKTTRYNDGTEIPNGFLSRGARGEFGEAYFDYDPSNSNSEIYGRLYNFYVVSSSNPRNVCPDGWHVPTDLEWSALVEYLGGFTLAGGKLKETGTGHWLSPNAGATNESGFTGLPGGNLNSTGTFSNIEKSGQWWTSTTMSASGGVYFGIDYTSEEVTNVAHSKSFGLNVRCIENNL